MKILHILDHSLPLHSGYTFRSDNIVRCQQQAALTPVVVTSPKHEQSWRKPTEPVEEVNGIGYYRSGPLVGPQLPFVAEGLLVRQLASRIQQVVDLERPDILHAHSPVLNAMAAQRVARKNNLPLAYEIRAFWEDAAVDHGTYGELGLKYRLVHFLETFSCKKVAQIFTICEGLKQDLLTRGIPGSKITIIPNAIDAKAFLRVERDAKLSAQWGLDGFFVLGFIGSFYHYEGLDLLLQAVARLSAELPQLKVLLVGGGSMERDLRNLAQQLNIVDRVVFTGRLPHGQMPAMYSLIDVLVLPRKSMRLTELVTPLKPLESMAMRKPVLASDVGGHRELIQDRETGFLFQAGSVDALQQSIQQLYAAPDLLRQCTENAFVWVNNTRTWQANSLLYRNVYAAMTA
ncbi:MAG: glycosyltransferase, exosortase A system-associated [Desulfuromonadaceae bacterium]|nr:glycosyltransferase, exosortase A system-associated [Desulfuromonadaceae bacterium]